MPSLVPPYPLPLLPKINALSSPALAPSTISQRSKEAVLTSYFPRVSRAGSISNTVDSLRREYSPHTPMSPEETFQSPKELLLLKRFLALQGFPQAFASPTVLRLNVMRELERCMVSKLS